MIILCDWSLSFQLFCLCTAMHISIEESDSLSLSLCGLCFPIVDMFICTAHASNPKRWIEKSFTHTHIWIMHIARWSAAITWHWDLHSTHAYVVHSRPFPFHPSKCTIVVNVVSCVVVGLYLSFIYVMYLSLGMIYVCVCVSVFMRLVCSHVVWRYYAITTSDKCLIPSITWRIG